MLPDCGCAGACGRSALILQSLVDLCKRGQVTSDLFAPKQPSSGGQEHQGRNGLI